MAGSHVPAQTQATTTEIDAANAGAAPWVNKFVLSMSGVHVRISCFEQIAPNTPASFRSAFTTSHADLEALVALLSDALRQAQIMRTAVEQN